MIRIVAALLLVALAACSTTSTVHQSLPPAAIQAQAYAYVFENNAGDDLEGIARLDRAIHARLLRAGLVAGMGTPQDGNIEIELTHYYVRSNTARYVAGILAGRDRIASKVTVRDAAGTELARFEIETTNLSSWGSTDELLAQHADDIVARLGR